jgi:hypothetical protein
MKDLGHSSVRVPRDPQMTLRNSVMAQLEDSYPRPTFHTSHPAGYRTL